MKGCVSEGFLKTNIRNIRSLPATCRISSFLIRHKLWILQRLNGQHGTGTVTTLFAKLMTSLCWFTISNLLSRCGYALNPTNYFWNDRKFAIWKSQILWKWKQMFILSTTLAPLSRNMDICQTLRSLECRHIKSLLSWPSDNILVQKYRVLLKAEFFKEKKNPSEKCVQLNMAAALNSYWAEYSVWNGEAKVLLTHTTPRRSWHR